MRNHKIEYPYKAIMLSGVLALTGCVSFAPIEPIKNPPTMFRSDNVVDVEFLHPAQVGLRCAERGAAAYGIPVFHAMACGNGKLITMPDACDTFTGGAFAALVCEQRGRVADLPDAEPEWQSLLQTAAYPGETSGKAKAPAPRARDTYSVEFVHPAAVVPRCAARGLAVADSEEGGLAACGDADLITLPNPCMSLDAGWYPRTLCHEMAHANGWAFDHPGGSFMSDARAGVDPNDVPPPLAILASLDASAPLRPASESPAYLAYAASMKPADPAPLASGATLLTAAFGGAVLAQDVPEAGPKVMLVAARAADLFEAAPAYETRRIAPSVLHTARAVQSAVSDAVLVMAGLLSSDVLANPELKALLQAPAPVAPTPNRKPAMVWPARPDAARPAEAGV